MRDLRLRSQHTISARELGQRHFYRGQVPNARTSLYPSEKGKKRKKENTLAHSTTFYLAYLFDNTAKAPILTAGGEARRKRLPSDAALPLLLIVYSETAVSSEPFLAAFVRVSLQPWA